MLGPAVAVVLLLSLGSAGGSAPARVTTVVPTETASPTRTPWAVLALGDSVTAGSGCDCDPFPLRYARLLADHADRDVTVVNEGAGGATSGDLLARLRDPDDPLRTEVEAADIDVITIGANDFAAQHDDVEQGDCGDPDPLSCARTGLATLRTNLAAVVTQIHGLRSGRSTAVLITGYWNVFEDGDVASERYPAAGRTTSRALTRAVNGVEASVAADQGATYVDLSTPFVGTDGDRDPTGLLADDGDHPNARGHQAIADALLAAGVAPLPTS